MNDIFDELVSSNSVCVNIFSGDPYKIVLQPK